MVFTGQITLAWPVSGCWTRKQLQLQFKCTLHHRAALSGRVCVFELTCLLVVKEATIDTARYLVAPIKDNILFRVLIVITCIAVIVTLKSFIVCYLDYQT